MFVSYLCREVLIECTPISNSVLHFISMYVNLRTQHNIQDNEVLVARGNACNQGTRDGRNAVRRLFDNDCNNALDRRFTRDVNNIRDR